MTKERYKENTIDSFFGSFLYAQKVPEGRFLRKLNTAKPSPRKKRNLK